MYDRLKGGLDRLKNAISPPYNRSRRAFIHDAAVFAVGVGVGIVVDRGRTLLVGEEEVLGGSTEWKTADGVGFPLPGSPEDYIRGTIGNGGLGYHGEENGIGGWDYWRPNKGSAKISIGISGTIVRNDFDQVGNSVLVVRSDGGLEVGYLHMDEIKVALGKRVSAGQEIGIMGNVGQSDWTHLHLWIKNTKTGEFDVEQKWTNGAVEPESGEKEQGRPFKIFENLVANRALADLGLDGRNFYFFPTGIEAWGRVVDELKGATDERQAAAFPPGVKQWVPIVRAAIGAHKKETGIEYPLWFVLAIITQESQGIAEAHRDEPHVNDASFGLGQIMGNNLVAFGIPPESYEDPLANVGAALDVLDWSYAIVDGASDADFMYKPYCLAALARGYNAGPGMARADYATLSGYSIYPVIHGDNVQRMAIMTALTTKLMKDGYSANQVIDMLMSKKADQIAHSFHILLYKYVDQDVYVGNRNGYGVANAEQRYTVFLRAALQYAIDGQEINLRIGDFATPTDVGMGDIWNSTPEYKYPLNPVMRLMVNGFDPTLFLQNEVNADRGNFYKSTATLYKDFVIPYLKERRFTIPD